MTDITITDGEATTAPAQDAVTEGVKVAEQIIETAQVLKAQDDSRTIELLHDVISRLNHLSDRLDGIYEKLNLVEMQVINNTISVENAIEDLADVADEVADEMEEAIDEVVDEVVGDVAIEAVEKVDAPALEIVEVREEPKKKKRVWL